MLKKCILILGPGRCGSSALATTLDALGIASDLGECGEVIFDVFNKIEGAAHATSGVRSVGFIGSDLATVAVQQTLNLLHDSTTDYLGCKPVGLTPELVSKIRDRGDSNASEFYWRVIKAVFPDRHIIFLIRDPVNWMLSAHIRWGFSPRTALVSLRFYLQALKDGIDVIDYVGRMEDLNDFPREFIASALQLLPDNDQARCVASLCQTRFAKNVLPDDYNDDTFWNQVSDYVDINFHSEVIKIYHELSLLGYKYNIPDAINVKLIGLNGTKNNMSNTSLSAIDSKYKIIADEIWESKLWLERVNGYLRADNISQAKIINEQRSWILSLQARLDIK